MPDDEKILGFSNIWYRPGIENKIKVDLDGESISIFSLPYFLASKFEAFENRGKSDPRLSSDLEDIVIVLDGIKNFELENDDKKIGEFLSTRANYCLNDRSAQEAIDGFLSNRDKTVRVNQRLGIMENLRN